MKTQVEIIQVVDILTFSSKVTEKINQKYLKTFFRNILNTENIIVNSKSVIFYNFFNTINEYEIYYFESLSKNIILEPFVLENYYLDGSSFNKNSYDLFVTDNFFALYQNKILQTFRIIKDEQLDDIKIYLEEKYKIKLSKTIFIDNEKLREFKSITIKKNDYKKYKNRFVSFSNESRFYIFLTFILISIILFYIYENMKFEIKESAKKSEIKVFKDKTFLMVRVESLFKYLKLYEITLDNFHFKNKTILINVDYKNKNTLFDFINGFQNKKRININSISFDEENKLFKSELSIEF